MTPEQVTGDFVVPLFQGDDIPGLFLALLSLFEIHVVEIRVDLGCV